MQAKIKSSQKVTKVQLNLDSEQDNSFLGIVSSDPDYKLSLLINKKLNINLQNDKPVVAPGKDGYKLSFSRFSDIKAGPEKTLHLVCNRHESDYLIKKMKKLDYLFQINSPDDDRDIENIASRLREITSITAVFILRPSDIGKEIYSI